MNFNHSNLNLSSAKASNFDKRINTEQLANGCSFHITTLKNNVTKHTIVIRNFQSCPLNFVKIGNERSLWKLHLVAPSSIAKSVALRTCEQGVAGSIPGSANFLSGD